MRTYTFTHVSDQDLLRDLDSLVEQERVTSAALVAHFAEADARQLEPGTPGMSQIIPTSVDQYVPGSIEPVASQRFLLKCTLSKRAYDKLRRCQELLSDEI